MTFESSNSTVTQMPGMSCRYGRNGRRKGLPLQWGQIALL